MGIPSYFSYIVKNHSNIIRKLVKNTIQINNLYLDCNSIIYDAVHGIDFSKLDDTDVNTIIRCVVSKIDEYIHLLQPNNFIFIAFDGVAPVAKLEQQRGRRYKSVYQNQISKNIFKDLKPDPWNTTAITPGTKFMAELNLKIKQYYNDAQKYKVKSIILSTSEHFGEGEHKLFDFIRKNPKYHTDDFTTVIYGLDADLIMLCINHLPISSKTFLFRETPHFIKTINSDLEPNETYLLDIPELAKIITLEMSPTKSKVYDYIFMCFFLGNDFMPHFPSVNIRTGGVDKMMNAYKASIGPDEILTDGKTIFWHSVRKLVSFLAKEEEKNFKNETKLRDKREKMFYPVDTPENKFKKFEALPNYDRKNEKTINPYNSGWEIRYYKTLFNVDITEELCEEICKNYLEGLEWTMKYYTVGCADWRWCYKYSYPPLLADLVRFFPDKNEFQFINNLRPRPVSPLVQLCYVLPKQSLTLLPEKLYSSLMAEHDNWYKTDCDFKWAYCRYFWEAHVQLPDIDIDELEKFVGENILVETKK
jgi:5'-3' exoribonuclease 1